MQKNDCGKIIIICAQRGIFLYYCYSRCLGDIDSCQTVQKWQKDKGGRRWESLERNKDPREKAEYAGFT